MSRRHVQPLLSDYIDGTLPPAAVRRVEAHLACCSECAQELVRWRAVLRLVSHHAPMFCPIDCAETVLRTIEDRRTARMIGDARSTAPASGESHFWLRLRRAVLRPWPAVAALTLLVLLLGSAWLRAMPGLTRTPLLGQLTIA